MGEKIKKILSLSICLLISMSFITGNALAEFEDKVTGELIISGDMRVCPFTHCQLQQTLEKAARVIILGIDRRNENMEWYVVIGENGHPNTMHYSLFTQDYRDVFLNNEVTSFIFNRNEFIVSPNELLRTCPSFNCDPYSIYPSVDYGLVEIKEKSKEWYRAQVIKEIEVLTFDPWGDTIILENPISEEAWIHEDAVPDDIKENFAALHQINTKEKQTSSPEEFVGTLAMSGTLRNCPSLNCEVVRYYVETVEIKIVGLDDNNEWYQVKPYDDYGNELNGWMHYSLFTQDYRDNFLETHSLSNEEKGEVRDKEEVLEKSIILLSFLKNKSFQTGLILMFVVITLLFGIFLIRKRVKGISQLKGIPVDLRKKKLIANYYGILVAFLVVIGLVGTTYGAIDYYKTSKLIAEAEQLTQEEKYNEAIEKLESTQDAWLTRNLGIKRHEINKEIEKNKEFIEDKSEYAQGIEEFNQENWGKAKELLSRVSELSPYYQEAKNKIGELENKITEGIITEAIQKATKSLREDTEEARRKVEEAQQRQKELEARQKELERQQEETPEIPYDLVSIIKQWKPIVGYVECEFRYSNYNLYSKSSGSGIAIDFSNFPISVITNKHVIIDDDGYVAYSCSIRLPGRSYLYSNEGQWEGIFTLSSGKDGGYIQIDKPNNYIKDLTSAFPKKCTRKPSEGEEVAILGYPIIGSQEDITITKGIISGFEGDYYITDAKIDQGNSGGAAILLKDNCLLGLPTYVITGKMETLGRILDISEFIK